MRRDARSGGFVFERANPQTRARIGEGFLLYGRYDLAAACFETAAAGAPDEPELAYPLACALAADQRHDAETRGRAAMSRTGVPGPAVFVSRLASAGQPLAADQSEAAIARLTPLVTAALREPWRGEPHRELGRALLQLERVRPAVFELATAAGITHKGLDLGWLGEGYEAMGATDEARTAYRTALALGIESEYHDEIFRRFMKLGPTTAPNANAGQLPSFGSMPENR
jgi:tetratricopeptide (TPR) repeat protein